MDQRVLNREFLKYVFLNILGQIAYSCYTIADTFFVSAKLGTNGLTALNLAYPMFCLMNGIGLLLGMGGGTRYTIYRSRGEEEKANAVFTHTVCLTTGTAAVFFLIGLFFSEPLVKWLGADCTVFIPTHTYLQVMLLFAPAFLTNTLLQCFVRNDGSPAWTMAAMICGSLSNIVLDFVFIFPLDMGIFGAILATGLAPVISILVMSPYLIRRKNGFHLVCTVPSGRTARDIASSGLPPFLTEVTSGIVMFLFNRIMLRLAGNTGVAAFGIVTVISLVVVAIYTGVAQGVQPLLSKYYGLQKGAAIKTIFRNALITALTLSAVIYSIIYFGADILAAVFNWEKDPQLQAYAVTGLKLYFTACPFMGLNIVLATYFISTDRTLPAHTISLLRGCIILIPMAFFLSYQFAMTGVWCACPATECTVAGIGALLYWKAHRAERKSVRI